VEKEKKGRNMECGRTENLVEQEKKEVDKGEAGREGLCERGRDEMGRMEREKRRQYVAGWVCAEESFAVGCL